MALKLTKEIAYWLVLILYAIVLFCGLLYLRFPIERFHAFCEEAIEERVPGSDCSIGDISYRFPLTVAFSNIVVKNKQSGDILYADNRMLIRGVWHHPASRITFAGNPFGGTSSGTALLQKEKGHISFKDLHIAGVTMERFPLAVKKLDRNFRGTVSLVGEAGVNLEDFSLVSLDCVAQLQDAMIPLKKKILQQNSIEIAQAEASLLLAKGALTIKDGSFEGPLFAGKFSGKIESEKGMLEGTLTMTGTLQPQGALYTRYPQLKGVVSRIEARNKEKKLAFRMGGSVERPTFVFGM